MRLRIPQLRLIEIRINRLGTKKRCFAWRPQFVDHTLIWFEVYVKEYTDRELRLDDKGNKFFVHGRKHTWSLRPQDHDAYHMKLMFLGDTKPTKHLPEYYL